MNAGQDRIARPLKGFEKVSRFWDSSRNTYTVKVKPGEYYASLMDEPISTTLGSCIAVCVRDTRFGIGGMNHFMLPDTTERDALENLDSGSARYGSYAMEHLVNTLFAHGARKKDLEFKVFGGGAVLQSDTHIGESNIAFIRRYMRKEGYRVASEDLGGVVARKLVYFPISGRALIKHMRTDQTDLSSVIRQEETHMRSLRNSARVSGDIELF